MARYARPRSVKNSTPASAVVSITCAIASRSPGLATFGDRDRSGHRAHVPARGHGHDVGLVLDQRDHVDGARVVGYDRGAAGRLVRVADRDELLADDAHEHVALGEDAAAAP